MTITTASPLPGGTINAAYTTTLAASGGTAPYTWSSSGTLPKGLTLSSAGILAGTPTVAGSNSFSVTVTDSESPAKTANLAATLAISDGTIAITTGATLPGAVVGSAYSQTLAAGGGTPPYTWTVTAGTLPRGLILSSAGVFSGTPTAAGTATFTITATDSASTPGTATLAATLVVAPALAITTTSPLPGGIVGSAYSQTLAASGGTAPYTWSVTAGTLPAGLALSSAGVLSGTPTATGSFTFTVQATDAESTPQTAPLAATLAVGPALAITTPSPLPSGTEGTAYSGATFAATGGVPPYIWSIPATSSVPPGLTLSSAGVLSGTPSTPAARITVQVADSEAVPEVVAQTFVMTINPVPSSTPIPNGTYAFVFAGVSLQGSPAAGSAVDLNGTFTIDSGKVLSGIYDKNRNSGPVLQAQAITGGTLTNYTNGLGTLVLNTAGGPITFALAIPVTGSDIRIIEFDDTTGNGTRGSGELKVATVTPSLPTGVGSFAFLVSSSNPTQEQEALACSFQIDGTTNTAGALNIVSLKADANQISEGSRSFVSFSSGASTGVAYGSLALDAANGRGVLTFDLGGGTFHFSFYEVSQAEWFVNSVDPANASAPLASGTVYQQSGPFSTASIPAQSVIEVNGLAPVTGGTTTVPDVSLGLAANAGSGTVKFTYDQYNGALTTGNTLSVPFAVDPVTGRAANPADTTNSQPVMYLINSNISFILFPGNSANSGTLVRQTGSSFNNSSFSGNYLGGSFALSGITALNEAGLVIADGNGNFTSVTNQSTPTGRLPYVDVTGTYAVDGTGRVVVSAPDGITRIFYVASQGTVYYLTSDQGGYVGSFEQ